LQKHFGASELTPEWFRERLIHSQSGPTSAFLAKLLLKLHPAKTLGYDYFVDLHESAPQHGAFPLGQIQELGPAGLELESLKRLLVHPASSERVQGWVANGLLEAKAFTPDFLKTVAYHPSWETDEWLAAFKQSHESLHNLAFSEETATTTSLSTP